MTKKIRKLNKKIVPLLFLLLSGGFTYGQYNETIRTARPGQAVGPFTTGKYVFQVQSGLTHGGFDNGPANSGNYQELTNSIRYGLLESFEIRTAFRLRSDRLEIANSEQAKFGGLSFWNVGVRYNIVNGEGYSPSFGFQTDIKLNWIDKSYKSSEIAPRFLLIHGQKLSETFRLTTNWGISWNGNNNDPLGQYVINISFPIGDKLGGFIENYGQLDNGTLIAKWDTGIGYLVHNDFQVDISGGYSKNENMSDWFIDAGISWRIKVK